MDTVGRLLPKFGNLKGYANVLEGCQTLHRIFKSIDPTIPDDYTNKYPTIQKDAWVSKSKIFLDGLAAFASEYGEHRAEPLPAQFGAFRGRSLLC